MEIKNNLDWQSKVVVDIFDELSIWSAPFGRLMLENIPMVKDATVLDIGFGTGFPLIELAQRFGEDAQIYGVDIWSEAINRARQKIKVLGLNNVEIIECDAVNIPLKNNTVDLVTSNLGVNNFENKTNVYSEIHRILKPNGRLAITTNPTGTFQELFDVFLEISDASGFNGAEKFNDYIRHRATRDDIITEIENQGFKLIQVIEDATNFRFLDGRALLNHSLIRIGFRSSWDEIIGEENLFDFYGELIERIDSIVERKGAFTVSVPILYIEFEVVKGVH